MTMDIWIIYKGNTTALHFTDTSRAAAHMLGRNSTQYIIVKQEKGSKPKTVVPLSHDVSEIEKQIQAT